MIASRHSSEYSSRSEETQKIKVTKEEEKHAKGHLYSALFSNRSAVIAIFPALVSGAAPIIIFLFLGRILNSLGYAYVAKGDNDTETIDLHYNKILIYVYSLAGVAVFVGICKFCDIFLWIRNGAKLSSDLRRNLFLAMMKSEVTFFDTTPIGGVLTMLSEDAQQVQDAFGTTKSTQIACLGQFLSGIILAFVYSWQMALVAVAIIPILGIVVFIMVPPIVKHTGLRFKYLQEGMTIAEETLSSIRTVRGFNREDEEIKRFDSTIRSSSKQEQIVGYIICALMCVIMALIWAMTLFNLWFGSYLAIVKKELEQGDVMSVFGFCMFGCFGLIQLQGSLQSEQKAIAAGARILKLTFHQPTIPFEGGRTEDKMKGKIEFRNVTFMYPTRPVNVLNDVSFVVEPSQIAALVGHSGSGKSTCVQLLERYYDVNEGQVLIDDVDIREYDPRWLHRQIGLVSQEPTLFACSIKDNIKYGKSDATDEEVLSAARMANALKFIEKLTSGLDTVVGEKGCSLSGGQRQRIAIARAIIKDPAILITDEATSALDADSEKKVQAALDKVMINKTAVIVAHRLSTIRNAHVIYVFESGKIVESGTHDQLLALKGAYYNLVERQLSSAPAKPAKSPRSD